MKIGFSFPMCSKDMLVVTNSISYSVTQRSSIASNPNLYESINTACKKFKKEYQTNKTFMPCYYLNKLKDALRASIDCPLYAKHVKLLNDKPLMWISEISQGNTPNAELRQVAHVIPNMIFRKQIHSREDVNTLFKPFFDKMVLKNDVCFKYKLLRYFIKKYACKHKTMREYSINEEINQYTRRMEEDSKSISNMAALLKIETNELINCLCDIISLELIKNTIHYQGEKQYKLVRMHLAAQKLFLTYKSYATFNSFIHSLRIMLNIQKAAVYHSIKACESILRSKQIVEKYTCDIIVILSNIASGEIKSEITDLILDIANYRLSLQQNYKIEDSEVCLYGKLLIYLPFPSQILEESDGRMNRNEKAPTSKQKSYNFLLSYIEMIYKDKDKIISNIISNMTQQTEAHIIFTYKYLKKILAKNDGLPALKGMLIEKIPSLYLQIMEVTKLCSSHIRVTRYLAKLLEAIGFDKLFKRSVGVKTFDIKRLEDNLNYSKYSENNITFSESFTRNLKEGLSENMKNNDDISSLLGNLAKYTNNLKLRSILNQNSVILGNYHNPIDIVSIALYSFIDDDKNWKCDKDWEEGFYDMVSTQLSIQLNSISYIQHPCCRAWIDSYIRIFARQKESKCCEIYINQINKTYADRVTLAAQYFRYYKFLLMKSYLDSKEGQQYDKDAIYYEINANPIYHAFSRNPIHVLYPTLQEEYLAKYNNRLIEQNKDYKLPNNIDFLKFNFYNIKSNFNSNICFEELSLSSIENMKLYDMSQAVEEAIIKLYAEMIKKSPIVRIKRTALILLSRVLEGFGHAELESHQEIATHIQTIINILHYLECPTNKLYLKWKRNPIRPFFWNNAMETYYFIMLRLGLEIDGEASTHLLQIRNDYILDQIKFERGDVGHIKALLEKIAYIDGPNISFECHYTQLLFLKKYSTDEFTISLFEKFFQVSAKPRDKESLTAREAKYYLKMCYLMFDNLSKFELKELLPHMMSIQTYVNIKIASKDSQTIESFTSSYSNIGSLHNLEKFYFRLAQEYGKYCDRIIDTKNIGNTRLLSAEAYFRAAMSGNKYSWNTIPCVINLLYENYMLPERKEKWVNLLVLLKCIKPSVIINIINIIVHKAYQLYMNKASCPPQLINALFDKIAEAFNNYPYQSAWIIKSIECDAYDRNFYTEIKNRLNGIVNDAVEGLDKFCQLYNSLKDSQSQNQTQNLNLKAIPFICGKKVLVPNTTFLTPVFEKNPFPYEDYIKSLKFVQTMQSKEKPIKIEIEGERGHYFFIVKKTTGSNTEFSREPNSIKLIKEINALISMNKACRRLNFRVKPYEINFISKANIIIEWINNTETFHQIIFNVFKSPPEKPDLQNQLYNPLKDNPRPVLQKYFNFNSNDPNIWYEKRSNFVRTYAVWAVICDIMQLGDRHIQNILFDSDTCEVYHIDFELIFNLKSTLKVPETVPIRLTKNILAAFGPCGYNGAFMTIAIFVLKAIIPSAANIYDSIKIFINSVKTVLKQSDESFVKSGDLLADKKKQTQLDRHRSSKEIFERYLVKLSERLDNIIKSPLNYWVSVCVESCNPDLLRRMFEGWCPWI